MTERIFFSDNEYIPGREPQRWNGLRFADFFESTDFDYTAIPPNNGFGFPVGGSTEFDPLYPIRLIFPEIEDDVSIVASGLASDSATLKGQVLTTASVNVTPSVMALMVMFNRSLKQSGSPRDYYYYVSRQDAGEESGVPVYTVGTIRCYPFRWGSVLGEAPVYNFDAGTEFNNDGIIHRVTVEAGDWSYQMKLICPLGLRSRRPDGTLRPLDSSTIVDLLPLKAWKRSRFWLATDPAPPITTQTLSREDGFGPGAFALRDAIEAQIGQQAAWFDYDWDDRIEETSETELLKSYSMGMDDGG